MKYKIALTVKDTKSPIEIELEEDTFRRVVKLCQEKFPDKEWNISGL